MKQEDQDMQPIRSRFLNLVGLIQDGNLIPEGVAEHCRFAGQKYRKEKPQKTKKQNRGEER